MNGWGSQIMPTGDFFAISGHKIYSFFGFIHLHSPSFAFIRLHWDGVGCTPLPRGPGSQIISNYLKLSRMSPHPLRSGEDGKDRWKVRGMIVRGIKKGGRMADTTIGRQRKSSLCVLPAGEFSPPAAPALAAASRKRRWTVPPPLMLGIRP
jgi:hypothetical protein